MKKIVRFVLLFFVISGLIVSQEYSFKIAYTGTVKGTIGLGGCPCNNIGGVARRATVLDSLSNNNDDIIIMDAGNFSFKLPVMTKNQLDSELPQVKFLAKLYNKLNYDIVNIGPYDISGGYKYLAWLKGAAKNYKIVSANIYDKIEDKLLFKPYNIINIKGQKVGVLGITSSTGGDISRLEIKPLIPTVQEQVKYLKSQEKVDRIILLAALNRKDYNKLVESDIAVDLILTALPSGHSKYLIEKNNKIVARSGTEGKYIGYTTVEINDPKQDLDNVSYALYSKNFVNRRIQHYKDTAGDKSLEEYMADKKRRKEIYNNMLQTKEKMNEIIKSAVNPVDFELIPLDSNIEEMEEIEEAVRQFKK